MKTTYENGDPIIAIVPIQIAMDRRLSLPQVRLLISICSYRSKETGVASVKRSTLADRCGYPETKISTLTTGLVELGWLVKEGDGGRSKASSYRITVPDLDNLPTKKPSPPTETVTPSETVTHGVTQTVTPGVTRSIRNLTKQEQSNTPLPPKGTVVDLKVLTNPIELPACIPKQSWDDWCRYRRERKKPITESAARLQIKSLTKWAAAGHDPTAIIETSIMNGWQGLFEPKVLAPQPAQPKVVRRAREYV